MSSVKLLEGKPASSVMMLPRSCQNRELCENEVPASVLLRIEVFPKMLVLLIIEGLLLVLFVSVGLYRSDVSTE